MGMALIRDRIKELRRVKASTLIPNVKNWRKHPDSQKRALRGVLAEVGYADALLARETEHGLMLLDGHLRAETTPEQNVPVLILDVTEEEGDKILATLDPLAGMAQTNDEALKAILKGIETKSDDMKLLLEKIARDEHVSMEEPNAPGAGGDEFDGAAKEGETRVKSGDIWQLGEHRLLCGDCTVHHNLSMLFGDERAALVVTSPPYNQSLDKFSANGMHVETRWVKNINSGSYFDSKPEEDYQSEQAAALVIWSGFLNPDGSIFYNHKNRYREKQVVSPWQWIESAEAKVRQEIIWRRDGSVTQNARMFMPCDERIFWIYFGDDFYFDDTTEHKTWSSVWEINSHKDNGKSEHGCAFPLELPSRCIAACSRPGDIVLEPYCGSGTTIIAAERLKRRCYGIEIAPKYCDVVLRRWEAETGKQAVLLEGAHHG